MPTIDEDLDALESQLTSQQDGTGVGAALEALTRIRAELTRLASTKSLLEESLEALSEAKLQALVDMHHTSMRHRKYGREPEWLGAAFTELRAKYEAELEGKTE